MSNWWDPIVGIVFTPSEVQTLTGAAETVTQTVTQQTVQQQQVQVQPQTVTQQQVQTQPQTTPLSAYEQSKTQQLNPISAFLDPYLDTTLGYMAASTDTTLSMIGITPMKDVMGAVGMGDTANPYGRYSEWKSGGTEVLQTTMYGSPEKYQQYKSALFAREQTDTSPGYIAERALFGVTSVATDDVGRPLELAGSGLQFTIGFGLAGMGLSRVAASGGALAPTASTLLRVGGSKAIQYGLPAAFVGYNSYVKSEGFSKGWGGNVGAVTSSATELGLMAAPYVALKVAFPVKPLVATKQFGGGTTGSGGYSPRYSASSSRAGRFSIESRLNPPRTGGSEFTVAERHGGGGASAGGWVRFGESTVVTQRPVPGGEPFGGRTGSSPGGFVQFGEKPLPKTRFKFVTEYEIRELVDPRTGMIQTQKVAVTKRIAVLELDMTKKLNMGSEYSVQQRHGGLLKTNTDLVVQQRQGLKLNMGSEYSVRQRHGLELVTQQPQRLQQKLGVVQPLASRTGQALGLVSPTKGMTTGLVTPTTTVLAPPLPPVTTTALPPVVPPVIPPFGIPGGFGGGGGSSPGKRRKKDKWSNKNLVMAQLPGFFYKATPPAAKGKNTKVFKPVAMKTTKKSKK